jgi:hypothetical protein
MKRYFYLFLLFLFPAISFSQLLSLDGSRLYLKFPSDYTVYDVATGKHYSTTFELPKYKPDVQHINFQERKLYVLFVPEKESFEKKYFPQIYSFDFETMTPEFVTEANVDHTSHLAVTHGIVAMEYDNLYEIKDKKLVKYDEPDGGVCIGVTDSLIAFYRYYVDYVWNYNSNKTSGLKQQYHSYDRDDDVEKDYVSVEVYNRETYCYSCGGTGYRSQGSPSVCTKCGGTGLKQ